MAPPHTAPKGLFEAFNKEALKYNSLNQDEKNKSEGKPSLDDSIREVKTPKPKGQ
jgi:hypothetical protein